MGGLGGQGPFTLLCAKPCASGGFWQGQALAFILFKAPGAGFARSCCNAREKIKEQPTPSAALTFPAKDP